MPNSIFVLGNGPSLSLPDLRVVHEAGIPCIAMNRIHEIPKGQCRSLFTLLPKWRPAGYVLSDKNWNGQVAEDVEFHIRFGYPCWIRQDLLGNTMAHTHPHVTPIVECEHDYISDGPSVGWHFENEAAPLCQFGGSMHVACQVAVRDFKADKIFLLGCDLGAGHFYPTTYDPDAAWLMRTRIRAHEIVYAECHVRGIEIHNCTPGGRLEVFPRLPLRDALEESK